MPIHNERLGGTVWNASTVTWKSIWYRSETVEARFVDGIDRRGQFGVQHLYTWGATSGKVFRLPWLRGKSCYSRVVPTERFGVFLRLTAVVTVRGLLMPISWPERSRAS